MFHKSSLIVPCFFALSLSQATFAEDLKVKISSQLSEVKVQHKGQTVTIQRVQDPNNRVVDDFALTSRACPPFCVQPMVLAPGVTTIGELELFDFLQRKSDGDDSILIIDSRTPDWVEKGTIPSATNLPWTKLHPASDGYEPIEVEGILTLQFNASVSDGIWNFSNAKTLVFFCNGPWCGQSPTNIRALINLGYPAHKIFWYRGGMQAWQSLGLTTVKP
ncbi:MAG: rhodanese-like domain-containing protein [Thiomicrospira sp.]|uniref:rhodanese-like domain-containing protein n=1 Tax=Thiomicrospira sp. TaxID=935 RepID=UPI0019E7A612|nr:rhodanese-like domain-containing protein [Thiomicrospira sp.]MBE0493527.1 rhodanese-like domain-containing protein [Thiomicrospira sp.]